MSGECDNCGDHALEYTCKTVCRPRKIDLEHIMKWISVKDSLPDLIKNLPYSQDVLTVCMSHGRPTEFGTPNTYPKGEKYISIDRRVKWEDNNEISFVTERFYGDVTHWMPLPEFPKS
jgi:hypothetical protein